MIFSAKWMICLTKKHAHAHKHTRLHIHWHEMQAHIHIGIGIHHTYAPLAWCFLQGSWFSLPGDLSHEKIWPHHAHLYRHFCREEICTCSQLPLHVHTYVHNYVHEYIKWHIQAPNFYLMCVCAYLWVITSSFDCVCICLYIITYIHVKDMCVPCVCVHKCVGGEYTRLVSCAYVHTHTYIHVCMNA